MKKKNGRLGREILVCSEERKSPKRTSILYVTHLEFFWGHCQYLKWIQHPNIHKNRDLYHHLLIGTRKIMSKIDTWFLEHGANISTDQFNSF